MARRSLPLAARPVLIHRCGFITHSVNLPTRSAGLDYRFPVRIRVDNHAMPRPAGAGRNVFLIQPRRDAIKAEAFAAECFLSCSLKGPILLLGFLHRIIEHVVELLSGLPLRYKNRSIEVHDNGMTQFV